MARRRKKSSASTPRSSKSRLRVDLSGIRWPDWHVVKRSGTGVMWLAMIAGLIAGWMLGVPRLQAFAAQRHHVPPHEVSVRFINQPQWAQGPLADALLRTACMQVRGNPLDRSDLVAIRQTLLDTGWFHSVDQVRRVESNVIEIEAEFVRPYALMRDDDGFHLIDQTARLLPKSYAADDPLPVMRDAVSGATVPMIAISGAHFARPASGGIWEGADVAAAIKLLQLLGRQPWRAQVKEIDVSEFLNDGPIRLRTDAGSTIIWGGPPGEEAALELRAEGKIDRLQLLYENHGRIDGNRLGELDITGERVTVAR